MTEARSLRRVGVFSRRLIAFSLFVAGFVVGCATGGGGDTASGDDGATGDDDGSTGDDANGDALTTGDGPHAGDGAIADGDGGPVDAAPDVPPVPCSTSDSGLGGIGIPSGTVATASGTYMGQTPSLTIDENLQTYWNGGGDLESLTLTFPTAQTISGVAIAAFGSPASSETYTVTGHSGGVLMTLGMATLSVPTTTTILPAIGVTPGTYTDLTLHVTSTSSWVAISEVTLVTPHCP
jgi:hypothetical protein